MSIEFFMRRIGGPILGGPRVLASILRRLTTFLSTGVHRATLASLGDKSVIQWGVRFGDPSVVRIGVDCLLWKGVGSTSDGEAEPLVIGDRVQINMHVHLDHSARLEIGDDTLLSQDVYIYTHDHGVDPHSIPVRLPKTIGNEVWIGMRAIVLASCQTIGSHAVIGAAAVVTRDVPNGAIVAGSPARIVGWRVEHAPTLVDDEKQ